MEAVSPSSSPGPLEGLGEVHNPFGFEGARLGWLRWVGSPHPADTFCMLASALSLVCGYRRSGGRSDNRSSGLPSPRACVPGNHEEVIISLHLLPEHRATRYTDVVGRLLDVVML